MDNKTKQALIDQIQQCAHLLYSEGEDVTDIFKATQRLNRKIVMDNPVVYVDFPDHRPPVKFNRKWYEDFIRGE